MPLAHGTRLGPFEVLDLLGAGGMGEVYRATDTRLGRIIALKILPSDFAADPARRERFRREARTLSSVSHPHVAALFDVGEQEGLQFLVMEYVEGETLASRLLQGPVPLPTLLDWCSQMAEALHAIHRSGIVHRDLKPSNVVLTSAGVKLIDFGIARLFAEDGALGGPFRGGETETLTVDGALVGSIDYMAPEQLEARSVDARVDFFALGVILFEMATGRRPFEAESRAGVVAAILSSEPPKLSERAPELPTQLEGIVGRCLEKDRELRWQSAADLAASLRRVAEETRRGRPARLLERRGPWRVATAALAIATVAVLASSLATSRWRGARSGPPTIRFEILPPAGTSFGQSGNPLAIAPDGRRVAFIASREGEPERLWVRALDSVEATEIAGTDHASQPFWSADSRSVGFVLSPGPGVAAGAAILAIDLAAPGAPPRKLGRDYGLGGTWSREGLLLVSQRGLLAGIPTLPGAPRWVRPPVTEGEEYQLWPSFLPGGRRYLYTLLSSRPERHGIYLAELDGTGARRIRTDSSNGTFVAPGYLVVGQRSALVAQPVDPSSLDLVGEPMVVAEPVAYNVATSRYTFSASDGASLVYRIEPETELVWYDRAGVPVGRPLPRGRFRDPEISPDGTQLAVSRLDVTSGAADIWTCDLARGLASRVTFDEGWEFAPVWSRDASALVYVERALDRYAFQLRRIATGSSSSASETILEQGRPFDATEWIASDDSVLWSLRSVASRLKLTPLATPARTVDLSDPEFRERQARLSRDEHWLAYVSDESGAFEVYVRAWPMGEKRKVSSDGGIEPRWRADGRELFYIGRDRRLMSVTVESSKGGAVELGRPTPLFETRMAGSILGTLGRNQYDVAPDGSRFLINQTTGETPFVVVVNWTSSLDR